MKLTNKVLFFISMAIGTVAVLTNAWFTNPARKYTRIVVGDREPVYLTEQLTASEFQQISRMRIATIVDLRPDGESPGQMPSDRVEALAARRHIAFAYIPVPHGDIPDSAVKRLTAVLDTEKPPILLYCRTGRRAFRTFCLAEAGRRGGQNAVELSSVAARTGFSVDDLKPEILRRINERNSK